MADHTDLSKYPEPVRAAYLLVLAAVATADGSASPQEIAIMDSMGKAAKVSAESEGHIHGVLTAHEPPNIRAWLATVASTDLKFHMLSDVFHIVNADGVVQDSEREQLHLVAHQLGITREQYAAIEKHLSVSRAGPVSAAHTRDMGSTFAALGIPASLLSGGTPAQMLLSFASSFIKAKLGVPQQQESAEGEGEEAQSTPTPCPKFDDEPAQSTPTPCPKFDDEPAQSTPTPCPKFDDEPAQSTPTPCPKFDDEPAGGSGPTPCPKFDDEPAGQQEEQAPPQSPLVSLLGSVSPQLGGFAGLLGSLSHSSHSSGGGAPKKHGLFSSMFS